jgi:uncharacterized membrane protein
MLKTLVALVASLAFGLLVAAAEQARGPMARLIRALLAGAVALLVLLGLVIGGAGVANEAWWAAVIGGLFLLLAARVGWSLRRRRSGEASVPSTAAMPAMRWRKLDAQVSFAERQRLRGARQAIESFLAERDSPSLTLEHQSLAVSLERRVPELIDTCLERCRRARPEERRRYLDQTLDRLTEIGSEAEVARREVRAADDQRLQVLHRYFDGVTDKGKQPELPKP